MAGKQMIDEPPTTAVTMPPRKPVPVRKKAVSASMRMGAGLLRFSSLAGQVHGPHQARIVVLRTVHPSAGHIVQVRLEWPHQARVLILAKPAVAQAQGSLAWMSRGKFRRQQRIQE